MKAHPLIDRSKLCVHTITTKPWPIEAAIDQYAAAGIGGITVWRQSLEGRSIARIGERIRQRGLTIASLCRGGFFTSTTKHGRDVAIEENRVAIREAAELGAPLVVLVCGATPGQSLEESRKQIADGIAAVLPDAEEHNIRLAIEPLHPMYADTRSAINTTATANEVCDQLNHRLVGIAVDVYHVWWDPDLSAQIRSAGSKKRLFAFHISDWKTPTVDLLNDRGLMGEGCIDIKGLRGFMEAAGFDGFHEVEIFSDQWWSRDQKEFLDKITKAYQENC